MFSTSNGDYDSINLHFALGNVYLAFNKYKIKSMIKSSIFKMGQEVYPYGNCKGSTEPSGLTKELFINYSFINNL